MLGGLYPEEMFKKDCLKWIQSFTAKQEALDNIFEMLDTEESITDENRDKEYIISLKSLVKKVSTMTELEVHEILKKYIEHYGFFDRSRILQ